jgi:hypothetical protein
MRSRIIVSFSTLLLTAPAAGIHSARTSQDSTIAQGKTPDLSGVWYPSAINTFQLQWTDSQGMPLKDLPMTPWAEEKFKANRPIGPNTAINSNDPDFSCFPSGIPKAYLYSYPVELIPTPGRLIMFFEYGHNVRQIFTDGRNHQKDANPTWMGDSIGHWEGDTLVVDSLGFNEKTWLDYNGHPHSEAMHIVELIRRPGHDTLLIDLTLDDPKAYTIPLHTTRKLILKPSWNIMESVCEDNSANFFDYEKRMGEQEK